MDAAAAGAEAVADPAAGLALGSAAVLGAQSAADRPSGAQQDLCAVTGPIAAVHVGGWACFGLLGCLREFFSGRLLGSCARSRIRCSFGSRKPVPAYGVKI